MIDIITANNFSVNGIASTTTMISMALYINWSQHVSFHDRLHTRLQIRTNFKLVAYPQLLKQALAAYYKNSSKMKELKKALDRAKEAGFTHSKLYKHVSGLFEAIDTVVKDFKVGPSQADAIFYKIWDLGGQEVCFCMLKQLQAVANL